MARYKFLEHTADLKVQVEGKNLEEAFINCALGLKEAIAEGIKVKEKIKKEIKVKGKDLKALLYSFLEEFLYLLDAKGFLLSKILSLKITKGKKKDEFELKASITGDKASNYKFSNDVKAITYNDMEIEQKKGKVKIIFVLDV